MCGVASFFLTMEVEAFVLIPKIDLYVFDIFTELRTTSRGRWRWSPRTPRRLASMPASCGEPGTTCGQPKRPTWRPSRSNPQTLTMLPYMPISFGTLVAKTLVSLSTPQTLMKSNLSGPKRKENIENISFRGVSTIKLILFATGIVFEHENSVTVSKVSNMYHFRVQKLLRIDNFLEHWLSCGWRDKSDCCIEFRFWPEALSCSFTLL